MRPEVATPATAVLRWFPSNQDTISYTGCLWCVKADSVWRTRYLGISLSAVYAGRGWNSGQPGSEIAHQYCSSSGVQSWSHM